MKKFKEFNEFKGKLQIIEDKMRHMRNKKDHPIDISSQISLKEFNEDLHIILNIKHQLSSEDDISLLNVMAKYAGIEDKLEVEQELLLIE